MTSSSSSQPSSKYVNTNANRSSYQSVATEDLRESLLSAQAAQQNAQSSRENNIKSQHQYGVNAKSRRVSIHTGAASPLIMRAHKQGLSADYYYTGPGTASSPLSPSQTSTAGGPHRHPSGSFPHPGMSEPGFPVVQQSELRATRTTSSGKLLGETAALLGGTPASAMGGGGRGFDATAGAAGDYHYLKGSPGEDATLLDEPSRLGVSLTSALAALVGRCLPGSSAAKVPGQLPSSRDTEDAGNKTGPEDLHEQQTTAREQTTGRTSASAAEELRRVSIALSYGVINFVCVLPTLVAYAHIVYASNDFEPFMPYILKIVMLSSLVHQAVFSYYSCLPFAIGQVQDVGLIFLAAITKNVQELAAYNNAVNVTADAASAQHLISTKEVVATSLWAGGISTALTGLVVFFVGYKNLVDYVSLLPLPVVGGYLGYIGWFCVAAGLTIMSGDQINAPWTVGPLFRMEQVPYIAFFCVFLFTFLFIHYRLSHYVFVMPGVLLSMPAVFLLVACYGLGYTMEQLREDNWLSQPAKGLVWGATQYELYDPRLVHWSYVPRQVGNWIGLTIVVCFGSSLDVAAIQAEIPYRLDFNSEMRMIGKSNFLVGLTGGMTGSYIFSQTIFCLKSQVSSALCGWTVFFLEFLLWVLPIDLSCVLPKPYVGALVALFGVDILRDWLWKSRSLLSSMEYKLVWIAFCIIMVLQGLNSFGVIEGMAISSCLAALTFVFLYSSLPVWQLSPQKRSGQFRRYNERKLLDRHKDNIFVAQLRGYIFFGSSMDVSTRLTNAITEFFEKADAGIVGVNTGGGGQASGFFNLNLPDGGAGGAVASQVPSPTAAAGPPLTGASSIRFNNENALLSRQPTEAPTPLMARSSVANKEPDPRQSLQSVAGVSTIQLGPGGADPAIEENANNSPRIPPTPSTAKKGKKLSSTGQLSSNLNSMPSLGASTSNVKDVESQQFRNSQNVSSADLMQDSASANDQSLLDYEDDYLLDSAQAHRYVVLDFDQVLNIDSTACVSLASAKVSLKTAPHLGIVHFVYSGIRKESIRQLLKANSAEPDHDFGALEDALNFVEEKILDRGGRLEAESLSLQEILLEYFRQDPSLSSPDTSFFQPRPRDVESDLDAVGPSGSENDSELVLAGIDGDGLDSFFRKNMSGDQLQAQAQQLGPLQLQAAEDPKPPPRLKVKRPLTRGLSLTDIRSDMFHLGLNEIANRFCVTLTLPPGAILFRATDLCNAVFFVGQGVVEVSAWRSRIQSSNARPPTSTNSNRGSLAAGGGGPLQRPSAVDHPLFLRPSPRASGGTRARSLSRELTGSPRDAAKSTTISVELCSWLRTRSVGCKPGSLLGNTAFAYPKRQMCYGYDAIAGTAASTHRGGSTPGAPGGEQAAGRAGPLPGENQGGCTVYKIDRAAMRKMESENPSLALLLHKVFLQEICYDAIRDLVE